MLRIRLNDRRFVLEMLPKDSVGVEIGVDVGDFSHHILRKVNPRELHLIDPWKYEPSAEYKDALYGGRAAGGQFEMEQKYQYVRARFEAEIKSGRVVVHRGFSADVLPQLPDECLDWAYVDGNHLYEFVKQDLELSYVKTKRGGYIAGDDYGEGSWWKGGVKRAVDEFIKTHNVEQVKIQNRHYVLRRPGG